MKKTLSGMIMSAIVAIMLLQAGCSAQHKYNRCMEGARKARAANDLFNEVAYLRKAKHYKATQEVGVMLESAEYKYYTQLYSQGLNYFSGKQWKRAVKTFKTALSYRQTPEASLKLQEAKDQWYLALIQQGKSAMATQNWENAIGLLETAQTIFANSTQSRYWQDLNGLIKNSQYQLEFTRGQTFEAQRMYVKALNAYKRAQTCINTPIIRSRITGLEEKIYIDNIYRARTHAENQRWDQAILCAQKAQSFRRSAFLTVLLQEAHGHRALLKAQQCLHGQKYIDAVKWYEEAARYPSVAVYARGRAKYLRSHVRSIPCDKCGGKGRYKEPIYKKIRKGRGRNGPGKIVGWRNESCLKCGGTGRKSVYKINGKLESQKDAIRIKDFHLKWKRKYRNRKIR